MAEQGATQSQIKSALKSYFSSGQRNGNILFAFSLFVNFLVAMFYAPGFGVGILFPRLPFFALLPLFILLGMLFVTAIDAPLRIKVLWFLAFPALYALALYLANLAITYLGPLLSFATPLLWITFYTLPLVFIANTWQVSRFWSTLLVIWFIFLFVVGIITNIDVLGKYSGKLDSELPTNGGEQLQLFWQTFTGKVNQTEARLQAAFDRQKSLATGDYYTGQVDQNAQKQLGVRLETIKLTEPDFYVDQPVSVFATFRSETINDPIRVDVSCTGKNNDGKSVNATPRLFPSESFTVSTLETQDIDCEFPRNTFKPGIATVTLSTKFPFKTHSYQKAYFIDKQRLRELRGAQIDPFDQYGIIDKNPLTVHTSGPVKIGMGIGTQPIGIDQEAAQTIFTLGVTLENSWPGQIQNVTRLILLLPKGFLLDSISGSVNCQNAEGGACQPSTCAIFGTDTSACDPDLYTVYELTPITRTAIKSFINFRARVRADRGDYELLLGASPIATRFFKTTLEYVYTFDSSINVNIKSLATQETDRAPPKASSQANTTVTDNSFTITYVTNKETNDKILIKQGSATVQTVEVDGKDVFRRTHTKTISGLSPGNTYAYEIQSTDKLGQTTAKLLTGTVTTSGTNTSSGVDQQTYQIQTQQTFTSNTLSVNWTSTEDTVFVRYLLRDAAGQEQQVDENPNSKTGTHTFTGLVPGGKYRVSITAQNAQGQQRESNLAEATLPQST